MGMYRRAIHIMLLALLLLVGCNLAPATPVPTPDLPTIEIIAPLNNATVLEGFDLTIDIVARDNGRGVARIELLIDDFVVDEFRPVERIEEPVFRVETNWVAEGIGKHRLSAIAYRSDGARSDEFSIVVEVLPPQ